MNAPQLTADETRALLELIGIYISVENASPDSVLRSARAKLANSLREPPKLNYEPGKTCPNDGATLEPSGGSMHCPQCSYLYDRD